MGKIKPSPEAIDSFVLLGEKMSKRVEQRLVDIAVGEIYWGVITPTQAALMLYGLPPPTPLETITVFKQTFIEKEKLIEKRYADTLTKIVETYKKFEHGKLKKVSGKEIDSLLEEANAYIKRLKKLMEQIEKRTGEKTVQKLHNEVFSLLENIFQTKSEKTLIENFSALIKKGEFPKRNLQILKEVKKAKDDRKKNKLTKHEVDKVRKNTQELIAALVEYAQRKELFAKEKARIKISIAGKQGELFLTKNKNTAFLIPDINKQTILKLNLKTKKQTKSNLEELANTLKEPPKKIELTAANLKQLQKILKKDLSLVF